ncbi:MULTISPECIES: amino acid ABC transporter permease [Variovorax]|uniref:amino acid ABC transporter permease n=1 Tax=Variovorax TaxID=34072 RepID=UPI002858B792|nr:amino acid ABC transporter permease [Variovorax sp. 3319]MDR6890990.1 general L-amino acid transport system permease protein [Variovorax sp. 3319]
MTRKWIAVLMHHQFRNWSDSIVTVALFVSAVLAVRRVAAWLLHEADGHALTSNVRFLLAGLAPLQYEPRLIFSAVLLVALGGCLFWQQNSRWTRQAAWPLFLAWAASVLAALVPIGLDRLGGLVLSVVITCLVTLISLPLGVLLALGRRSKVRLLSLICAGYVELMRSLPLLLVIYLIWVAIPLLSPGYVPHDLFRGLAALALFFAAYVSEYVRSGLQSVPKGQLDAAYALGLGTFDVNRDVVFPQALRVVVPTIAGNVLDIFNATPLLFIIGMTDFLRAGQLILANPAYTGKELEIYGFLALIYFAVGSLLTFVSRRLEDRVHEASHRKHNTFYA